MSIGSHKWVVTRKVQRCWGCEKRQPVGSRLLRWTSLFDGSWNSGYLCEPCDEIFDGMQHWEQEECSSGSLREYWPDMLTPPATWLPEVHA